MTRVRFGMIPSFQTLISCSAFRSFPFLLFLLQNPTLSLPTFSSHLLIGGIYRYYCRCMYSLRQKSNPNRRAFIFPYVPLPELLSRSAHKFRIFKYLIFVFLLRGECWVQIQIYDELLVFVEYKYLFSDSGPRTTTTNFQDRS
jgi:hypothetical protein